MVQFKELTIEQKRDLRKIIMNAPFTKESKKRQLKVLKKIKIRK